MPVSKKAKAVIDAFGQRVNTTGQHEALNGLLETSDLLASKFNKVVEQGLVKRIVLTNASRGSSQYHYDDRELKLNSSLFLPVKGQSDLYRRAGDLAGDLQHILQYPERNREIRKIATKAAKNFTADVREEGKETRSNLDRVKRRVNQAGKKIRGAAHKANKEVGRAAHKVNKKVGRAAHKVNKELGRAGGRIKAKIGQTAKSGSNAAGHGDQERNYTDPVRTYLAMKERYRADQDSVRSNVMADMALRAGDAAFNVAVSKLDLADAIERRHADAAEIIRWIAQRERHENRANASIDSDPNVRIDVSNLGLFPEDIAKHVNKGQATVGMRYIDRSDGMAEHLDLAYEEQLNRLNFDQNDHPQHQLFLQLLEKVNDAEQTLSAHEVIGLAMAIHEGARNNGISISPSDARANLVAAMMVESRDKEVVPEAISIEGQNVFIVQDPKSQRMRYCQVNYVEGALKPMDASCRQWDAMGENADLARRQQEQQSQGSAFQTKHQMLAPVMQELNERLMTQGPTVRR